MTSDQIPFSPPFVGDEEIEEVVATLRSGWLTTGPRSRQLETDFATRVEAPGALAVNSCTAAMEVALATFDVGAGDAVITTPMTFCATAHVIERSGAVPVFADVDPATLNIDIARIEERLDQVEAGHGTGSAALDQALAGRRASAIIPVHYAGHPVDLPAIFELARSHDLAVVEDAAHALPAAIGHHTIGTILDDLRHAVAFSFYATKNLTTGEGGMLTASVDDVAEARIWSLHGMNGDAWRRYSDLDAWYYEVDRVGLKCNMSDVQAAIGLRQLERLDAMQQRRREVVAAYDAGLADVDVVERPTTLPGVTSAQHLYVLRLHLDALAIDRSRFIAELSALGIATSVHFIPLHRQPYYRDRYELTPDMFPVAEREYHRLISLPLHPGLTDAQVERIIESVAKVAASARR